MTATQIRVQARFRDGTEGAHAVFWDLHEARDTARAMSRLGRVSHVRVTKPYREGTIDEYWQHGRPVPSPENDRQDLLGGEHR